MEPLLSGLVKVLYFAKTLNAIAEEKQIDYSLKIGSVPGQIEIDPLQFEEAFKNILVNAREASAENSRISIEFDGHKTRPGTVVISVIDQGKGIAPENMERVFEPYYSTKPFGNSKGTGLGMSIAYSIIKSHNGEILIKSTPGVGTRVDILLPEKQNKNVSIQQKKYV